MSGARGAGKAVREGGRAVAASAADAVAGVPAGTVTGAATGSAAGPAPGVAARAVAGPSAGPESDAAADVMGGLAADHALLDAMAVGALTRLDAMRPSFRLPAEAAAADPETALVPLGALAEMLPVIRDRHPLPAARDLADALFRFAWDETRDGELFAELVRDAPQATRPVEVYGAFARAGLRNRGAERLMAVTTSLRQWRVPRADPTRTLAVLNAERRIGLPPHADFDAVLAVTGLGQRTEPWALDARAVHGIAHDVFQVTDWGRAPHRLPRLFAAYLRLWVPAWNETCCEQQLWGLVGALQAVSACLPDAPHDSAAWQRLAAAQSPDGAVPESGTTPGGLPPGRAFTACYHSTLVTAFAATLARTADGPRQAAGHRPPSP